MRTSLCLLLLALCFVAFECTITANTEEVRSVNSVQNDVVVTKTTTTAAQKPPIGDSVTEKDDKVPAGRLDENEPEDEEAEVHEEEDPADRAQKVPEAPPPAAPITTTKTANKENTEGPQIVTDDAHSSSSGGPNPSHNPPTGRESGIPDQSLTASGQQVQNSQLEEVKTTTTVVPVSPPQPPLKANEKQDNNKSPTEHQAELEGDANARANIAGPTVTKGAPNKESQTITQPKHEGEDHSNGERQGTIQGGVNAKQVAAPITTTTTANKPSSKLPVTITDDVLAPALQGQGSSKTSTGVQNPVTPIKPADPTEDKKQIGAKTTTTTTKPATVNTESGAGLTTATITTDKQTASAETSTTPTVAPTTTLPKGFKIPQSLDKMDGCCSTSLLIAFATVVTFIMTAVAPVY